MDRVFPFSHFSSWSQARDFCSHGADTEEEVIKGRTGWHGPHRNWRIRQPLKFGKARMPPTQVLMNWGTLLTSWGFSGAKKIRATFDKSLSCQITSWAKHKFDGDLEGDGNRTTLHYLA